MKDGTTQENGNANIYRRRIEMMFLNEDDPRREVWQRCESPIEQIVCCALFTTLGCRAVSGQFYKTRLAEMAEACDDHSSLFLFSQQPVGIYRADFLIVAINPERRTARTIVVECDGKKYHGSESQIARDKIRDEYFAECGYRVVRFTGSEIATFMIDVLGKIREWLKDTGAVCRPPTDLGPLAGLFGLNEKTNKQIREERQKAREQYWNNIAIEERILAGITPDDL